MLSLLHMHHADVVHGSVFGKAGSEPGVKVQEIKDWLWNVDCVGYSHFWIYFILLLMEEKIHVNSL